MCYFRKDFRTDFRSLGSLRAVLPHASMLLLTATASMDLLGRMREVFFMPDARVLSRSPNRPTIYLQKSMRLAHIAGDESYRRILLPMARELNSLRQRYPLTIVYVMLECMKMVFRLSSLIVEDRPSDSGLRFEV